MAVRSHWLSLSGELFQGLADLVYPPVCSFCGRALAEASARFCGLCVTRLTRDPHAACPRCAETVGPFSAAAADCPDCRRWTLHFEAAFRLGPYEGELREAILRLKNWGGEDLADALGRLCANQLRDKLTPHRPDYVVPVPLHWLRRLERGYNQADALAGALAERLGVPCRTRWLRRTRHTPHQTGLSVTARRENVKNAFQARPRPVLSKKTIVLVDDVMTTGSTCSEAARVLKHAGAGRIIVAVLAKSTS
jgi:ComF family protein